jgi:two-component system, NtrC family, response regulator AtoC
MEISGDLYYRLNVVPLEIPPLRERKEDIKLLANFFLQKFSQENNKEIVTFDEDALKLLEEYTWPGNVRELSNIVERAVIMSTGSIIFPEDIFINQEVFHQKRKTTETNHVTGKEVETLPLRLADGQSLKDLIKQVENVIIQNKLTENHGNKMQTAKDLGISRRALLYKIQEHEIE